VLELEGVAPVPAPVHVEQPVHLEAVEWLEAQQPPGGPVLAIVDLLLQAGGDQGWKPAASRAPKRRLGLRQAAAAVLRDPVAAVEAEGAAPREQVLDDRRLDGTLELQGVEVAVRRDDAAVVLSDRLPGDHVDRARRCVAPVGPGLGAAQHLHGREVEHLAELSGRRVHVDVVVVDRDGAVRVRVDVVQSDAADEQGRVRGRERGLDLQVRCVAGDVADVGEVLRLDVGGVEGRDRGRLVLERRRRLLAGNEDLLDSLPGIEGRATSLQGIVLARLRRGIGGRGLCVVAGRSRPFSFFLRLAGTRPHSRDEDAEADGEGKAQDSHGISEFPEGPREGEVRACSGSVRAGPRQPSSIRASIY
jgi:hypothetical protein